MMESEKKTEDGRQIIGVEANTEQPNPVPSEARSLESPTSSRSSPPGGTERSSESTRVIRLLQAVKIPAGYKKMIHGTVSSKQDKLL